MKLYCSNPNGITEAEKQDFFKIMTATVSDTVEK